MILLCLNFFIPIIWGMRRIADEFDTIYNNLDEFLITIISELNRKELSLIICSDHGNFEDLSVKTHTRNPALAITAGNHALDLAEGIHDLSEIKSTIIKYCT